MSALRDWVLGVAAAAILAALAQTLMPEGPVKRVGKLTCGLVLLAAILRPLPQFRPEGGQRWLEDYFQGVEEIESELKQGRQEQLEQVIEEEAAAYILDKAAQLGLKCTVSVECRTDEAGNPMPAAVFVRGAAPGEAWDSLSAAIADELGIPAAEQYFVQEGAP